MADPITVSVDLDRHEVECLVDFYVRQVSLAVNRKHTSKRDDRGLTIERAVGRLNQFTCLLPQVRTSGPKRPDDPAAPC